MISFHLFDIMQQLNYRKKNRSVDARAGVGAGGGGGVGIE